MKATPDSAPASVASVLRMYREDIVAAANGVYLNEFDKRNEAFEAEVERLAAQAAPTEAEALRHLMGMGEAEIDAELLTSGIDPDDAVKRAVRAIDGALAIKAERRAIMYGDIVHNHVCAMRAAVVASHLESPEAGMRWIVNTLFGPGHLPDVDEAIELGGAQALFDKEMAEHEAFRAAHPAPVAAQPSQAPVVQAVPDSVKFICVDCTGCEKCRASSGATHADVRMLTGDEHEELENALGLAVYLSVARVIQQKFCEVNAGKRIPADGVIGGA